MVGCWGGVGGLGGVVCKVIFGYNPTKVVRLCCVVVGVGVGVVKIIENLSLPSEVDGWKMLN